MPQLLNLKLKDQPSRIFEADSSSAIERRIKVLTDGSDDTADPCVPVEICTKQNQKICALYVSGGRVLRYENLEDLLRGGIRAFHKIEVLTKDNHPLIMEPYHQAEAIWDTEVVVDYETQLDGSRKMVCIGYGGMMERVDPKIPCKVVSDNYRRSRHAFELNFGVQEKTGCLHETWRDLGPVHGNRPTHDGRWISKDENQFHAHGYGSRLIRDGNGFPWRDSKGHRWMTYEEVTEEVIRPNGIRIPFATKIFAREMNDSLTLARGNSILLSGYSSWQEPDRPFKASLRKDPNGFSAGFLVEGPNPILLKIGEKEFWVLLFSAGDFVAEYGNFMMYREKEEGPIGPYKHIIDENHELVDLTSEMVRDFDLTWAGRLNAFYDHEQKLWGLMHGIFKRDIPNGWEKSGWPRTQDEFIHYARRIFLVPLESSLKNGKPFLQIAED